MSNAPSKSPPKPGPRKARIADMLRVDHAGAYGAVQIYRGQRVIFDASPAHARTSEILKEMEEGEHIHLNKFNELLAEHKTRPTLLTPLWHVAGFALGAGTALMGTKAAMACTTAVEDVIEKHYAAQAEELGDTEPELKATIVQFREEELAHHDTAIEEGAEQTPGYGFLKGAIQAGCHLAIRISEKI